MALWTNKQSPQTMNTSTVLKNIYSFLNCSDCGHMHSLNVPAKTFLFINGAVYLNNNKLSD